MILGIIIGFGIGGTVVWFWKAQIQAELNIGKQKAEAELKRIQDAAAARGLKL